MLFGITLSFLLILFPSKKTIRGDTIRVVSRVFFVILLLIWKNKGTGCKIFSSCFVVVYCEMPPIVPEDTSLSVDADSEVTDTDSDIYSEIPLLVYLSIPVAVFHHRWGI